MIISNLTDIGFSEYEAKAYMGLLKSNPATSYEIAKNSGIPTSKIYEVIAKLISKGIILTQKEIGTKRYIPLNPDEFVESQRIRFTSTFDSLKENLKSINTNENISYLWKTPLQKDKKSTTNSHKS